MPSCSGPLWPQVQQQSRHALACGALQPIDTAYEVVTHPPMAFVVRILTNLRRKEEARQTQAQRPQGQRVNPFLPYDRDLFVAHLSPTHLCLLNKYNVVDHHVLMVTRQFEPQDSGLTAEDFFALACGLAEMDGLGFYNGGAQAGASQPHKHLQLVPFPLCGDLPLLPLSPLLENLQSGLPQRSPSLPFVHGACTLGADWEGANLADLAALLLTTYHMLLAHCGIDAHCATPAPYNLLVTRDWMMVVPRRQDSYQGIPVNALGFAGSLLVKNAEQMALLKALGPMAILQQVALEADSGSG